MGGCWGRAVGGWGRGAFPADSCHRFPKNSVHVLQFAPSHGANSNGGKFRTSDLDKANSGRKCVAVPAVFAHCDVIMANVHGNNSHAKVLH